VRDEWMRWARVRGLTRAPWHLRWQLTLGYTLVTIAAVLVFDVLSVVTQVAAAQARMRPPALAAALARTTAPRLRPALARTPPDAAGLWRALGGIAVGEATQDNADVTGGIGTTEGALLVVDARGRLLATLPPLAGVAVGSRLDRARLAGAASPLAAAPLAGAASPLAAAPLAAALAGVRDPVRLAGRTADGRVLAAAPVFDAAGRVRGVVIRLARAPRWTRLVASEVVQSALILTLGAGAMGTLFGFLTAAGLTRRLQRLSRAAHAWGQGDFGARATDTSADELGRLARDLNRMAEEVRALLQAREDLAALEARGHLARDLHDAVKQQVFATAMQVGAARKLLGRDQAGAEAHLAQADALVRGTQRELVALIHALRPPALDGRGLAAALRTYTAAWAQQTGIALTVRVGDERATDSAVEQSLVRVTQEALANVARHSGARAAEVALAWDEDSVTLDIVDDGRGFTPGAAATGFGLESMRTRLAQVGGEVIIRSAPGRGTQVSGVCPRAATVRAREKEGERWVKS